MQRFGDALNANVHFHSLVLDGVYEPGCGQAPRFFPLPAPDDAEVARVAAQVARKLCRLLEREGLGPEADAADPLASEEPFLATLTAASVSGRAATGPRAGKRTLRLGDRIDADVECGLSRCGDRAARTLVGAVLSRITSPRALLPAASIASPTAHQRSA